MKSTTKVIKKIEKLKELMFRSMGTEDVIMDMDPETLKVVRLCMGMVDDCCDLMMEYNQMMEEQNRKLDMILEKLDKGERA